MFIIPTLCTDKKSEKKGEKTFYGEYVSFLSVFSPSFMFKTLFCFLKVLFVTLSMFYTIEALGRPKMLCE